MQRQIGGSLNQRRKVGSLWLPVLILFFHSPLRAESSAPGTVNPITKIAAGNSFACAILSNHSLKCWGDNSNGQLGIEGSQNRGDKADQMGKALPAVNLGANRYAV